MKKQFKNLTTGAVCTYEVNNNRVIATLAVGERLVFNPSVDVLLASGWEEYTADAEQDTEQYVMTDEDKKKAYEQKVEDMIRERYSLSEELSLLRQRDTKADEYNEYFAYCEECKSRAKGNEDKEEEA